MDNTRAEIDRLSNLATDWGGKLDEWRELTGFSCPSACAAELARLRAALAAPAPEAHAAGEARPLYCDCGQPAVVGLYDTTWTPESSTTRFRRAYCARHNPLRGK